MLTTIDVTQELIDQALYYRNTSPELFMQLRQCACPIALAFQKATGKTWHITVSDARLFREGYDGACGNPLMCVKKTNKLPDVARRFVLDFDNHVSGLHPFSFKVNLQ